MQPVNKCPYRSPMAVSDTIKELIQDKVVCELGCAEGDNMVFMSRYAKRVVGFEYMKRRYDVAIQRGLEVVVGDYYKDSLPAADVYYFWPDDGEKDSEYLVQKILQIPNFNGTIIIGADTGFPPEVPSLKRCASLGRLVEVPYNEGSGHREHGIFLLAVIDASKLKQSCTFLLSSPRAGSSCTTASFNLCGLSLGSSVTTVMDQFNPKGYFENQQILTFNEKVFRAIGSSIFAMEPLHINQENESLNFADELSTIIKTEFKNDKFFMIKDPRINILQKLYEKVFNDLNVRITIVKLTRNIDHAAKSMNRMAGLSIPRAENVYKLHYQLIDKFASHYLATTVAFEDLVKDPNSILQRACYNLNIPYGIGRHNQAEINRFVEKGLVTYY